jgi:proteasome accessory factor A
MRGFPSRVPKLCGADIELGNFIDGHPYVTRTGYEASRAVLREIDGITSRAPSAYAYGGAYGRGSVDHSQDWGRKFLATNGGCVYIDLDHLELAVPEVLSAFDHTAACHAMFRIAQRASVRAGEKLPPGQRIYLIVNNSDGRSHSYGSHVNFLITRQAWEGIFNRKLHHQLFLAAAQVSSIVFTGAGKVGAENHAPAVDFQLSQRADFYETLTGEQTTFHRPIVNARDESLCGAPGRSRDRALARLHCIFFDGTMSHVANTTKVGMMQILLAQIEADAVEPDLHVLLDDPVDAVRRWSHDPTLRARARMVSGAALTAVEVQLRVFEQARRFCDAGGCDGIVPRADEILELWGGTLDRLKAYADGDESILEVLAPRIDWALKYRVLRYALAQEPALTWGAPEIRHLDLLYGCLDPEEGLYLGCEAEGMVERLVEDAAIEHLVAEPPEDTRAWARAQILRRAGPGEIASVNWDAVAFAFSEDGWGRAGRALEMHDPLAFTRAEIEPLLGAGVSLVRAVEVLGSFDEEVASDDRRGYLA